MKPRKALVIVGVVYLTVATVGVVGQEPPNLTHSNSPMRLEAIDNTESPTFSAATQNPPGIFEHLKNAARHAAEQAETTSEVTEGEVVQDLPGAGLVGAWTSRSGLGGTLQILLMVSVLSLAPAILLMTTCYVRVVIVLGLLRQALGTGQLPPTQILTSISIFITMFVMAPVWNRVYQDAIQPYTAEGSTMTWEEAWQAAATPVRDYMSQQIDLVQNQDDVHLFYNYHTGGGTPARSYEEVPLEVLLPAYMLSELKTAFLMGFMIYLPFLIIDLVVAAVTVSMGMMMLPPAMISLPFKLLLFVLVDGWHLVVGMLLKSFGPMA
ncbi:MAG: flagellar type III secretion system pore protein FliP [bacterium]|nr:flagellar type III secretion system pore protein FliP [bacterium]